MTTAARPSLTATIASHPITAYVVIAYAVSWTLTLLLSVSLVFGLLALFGPTLAAVVVTRSEGSFAELRERITAWRQPIVWYALAFGIPFAVAGVARLILSLAGQAPDRDRRDQRHRARPVRAHHRGGNRLAWFPAAEAEGAGWAWPWPV